MFAAAIHKNMQWYQNLGFNWFDVALVAVLVFGWWRGRKRGMSLECLPAAFWLVVVIAGAAAYPLIGDYLLNGSLVKTVFGKNFTNRTAVYICSYLLVMLVAYIIFAMVNRAFKARLEGSNAFGSSEYYLGMGAGVLRFACILLVALALLNAPYYTAAEIAASKLYKLNTYAAGGGIRGMEGDTGNFIPDLSEVQDSVFKDSMTGPFIKNHMGYVLINTVAPGKKTHVAGAH
jgi:uncharacterized membrane protein required for colicin V production